MKTEIITTCIIAVFLVSCKHDDITIFPVDLINPEIAAQGQPLNVILEWSNTNTESKEYLYDVFLSKSQSNFTRVDSNLTSSLYECIALELNSKYYWKVRLKSDGVYKDSEIREFTTTNELTFFEFQNSLIAIYPSEYIYEYPDSLMLWSQLELSGATSLINGFTNTNALVDDFEKYPKEGLYIAAKYCDELEAYGYSDWYLPSIIELDSVLNHLGIYGNTPSKYYWSSTEYEKDALFAYFINSFAKPTGGNYQLQNKDKGYRCRCIRKDDD